MTKIIALTSGKGGVGKSQIAANLAYILSENGYKTALLEVSDLPNLDIIINAKSGANLANFIGEECGIDDLFNEINQNLYFIASEGSEFDKFSDESVLKEVFSGLKNRDFFDFIIIDCANGNFNALQNIMNNADENIIVTIPEPAAISGAYAMMKLSSKSDFLFIVNFAKDEEEAVLIFENIKKVAKNNIKTPLNLNLLGFIKKSSIVPICAQKRSLMCEEFEYANPSFELKQIASRLLIKMGHKGLDIRKLKGIKGLLNKLSNLV
ncbi:MULTISPECIES: AAA family ATPase [unclassified Campylobacter]|uniref:AAA family ATPase n=1 Tax=unclassified Campylobacter TaxID=2593542 RepID=UPI0022E9B884|nr:MULTISPECIES: AAA family ATPase [unclassified Campylobacter]MDA3079145.1 AAA family ATPase [Campylobacter sp. CS_NA2]MDA3080552.1 AAA family ATPase [Campylobacter sp. CS_NA1]MDA3085243.1 AAA family ATPase [Campylobacter sp. CS_ED1]MDA3090020.1 AAA family ATPase [Campylobacter sp. CS_ED2]WBR51439.1 AAA family ATPase [Campylobacter sp. CS_NA3]